MVSSYDQDNYNYGEVKSLAFADGTVGLDCMVGGSALMSAMTVWVLPVSALPQS